MLGRHELRMGTQSLGGEFPFRETALRWLPATFEREFGKHGGGCVQKVKALPKIRQVPLLQIMQKVQSAVVETKPGYTALERRPRRSLNATDGCKSGRKFDQDFVLGAEQTARRSKTWKANLDAKAGKLRLVERSAGIALWRTSKMMGLLS